MIENFIAEAWDAWKDFLIHMLICSELGPLDPYRDDFLDEALHSLLYFFFQWFLVRRRVCRMVEGRPPQHGQSTYLSYI